MLQRVGLSTDEGLEQVKRLVECGNKDLVEVAGGKAENKSSKLHSKTRGTSVGYKIADRTLCKFHPDRRRLIMPKDLRRHSHTRGLICELGREFSRIEPNGRHTVTQRLSLSGWHGRCYCLQCLLSSVLGVALSFNLIFQEQYCSIHRSLMKTASHSHK